MISRARPVGGYAGFKSPPRAWSRKGQKEGSVSELHIEQIGPDTWRFGPRFRPTRFVELRFFEWGGDWRFADSEGHTIGPIYRTKAELLADVERFHAERWGQ